MAEIDATVLTVDEELINKNSGWTKGEDIIPSVYYRAFFLPCFWNVSDESNYRVWLESGSEAEAAIDEEQGEELLLVEPNAFGGVAPKAAVALDITPSPSLAGAYPDAIVIIDGKEYAGLSILNEPIKFYMDRDHRVVIDWNHGEVSETFRIVVNR